MKRLYNIKETAKYLGLGVYTVRELVWAQRLKPIQFNRGGKLLFDIKELDCLIKDNQRKA